MGKKKKDQSPKSSKKSLLKDIESKIAETIKGFHKKTSERKLEKQIHRAGKLLAKSLTTKENIKVVHKEITKAPKKDKKVAEKEVAS
jgi:aminoglycoside phosphotransferase family enzyme